MWKLFLLIAQFNVWLYGVFNPPSKPETLKEAQVEQQAEKHSQERLLSRLKALENKIDDRLAEVKRDKKVD